MNVAAIIAAGGRSQRLGGDRLKQFRMVGGQSVLERSVRAFLVHPAISQVVVALPAELVDDPPPFLHEGLKPVRIVAGGARRQDSVANAFGAVGRDADLVVIHDGARPFVTAEVIDRTIEAAAQSGAAVAAIPSRDTVKQTRGASRTVAATLPRDSIFLAQTPQAFRRDVLERALACAVDGIDVTDEAALAERAGCEVRLVDGDAANIKITTADDLPIAEAIAQMRDGQRVESRHRIGTGYDLHRLVEGRPLVLGGVTIPFERGLSGHSDADAVCHAVTDAVLGGAAAGDIGGHFPDTDPQWRGASSLDLLSRAAALVRRRGFTIGNVDVVVIAERPTLRPFVNAMRACVAAALDIAIDRVSIKGKTNEGTGETGRGEAIAVHAVALLTASGTAIAESNS